jgi:HK97 family phage prohead protease
MAEWDASYVNDLPDSSFLLILPGGKKDSDGKTIPRNLRYFPVRNAAGDIDDAHLKNALARIPQASTLSAAQRMAAMDKAKALAKAHDSIGGPAGTYAGTAGSGRSRYAGPEDALCVRSFDLVLEVRDEGDGRTLLGRAVPYGQTADIGGATERFVMGAFARQIAGNQVGAVKLYESHSSRLSGAQPIGKTLALREMTDGLHGEWPLYNTSKANDALELVRSGEVTGLSVGFKALPGGTRKGSDGALERHGAHLDHVVLTHEPIYAGAGITSLRSETHPVAGYRRDQARQHQVIERLGVPL